MSRSHPKCWTGHGYEHAECRRPTGKDCIEPGCNRPAGTKWGPLWCPECDVERLDRITTSLESMSSTGGV